jgi:hypothetical protein
MAGKLSTAAKAYVGAAWAVTGSIAATFPDTMIGKVCIVAAAGLGALVAIYKTKNTQVVTTGPGDGPVQVAALVSSTGAAIGTMVADTGAAAGGIVAGTTGLVGGVLDTVGKVLPGGGKVLPGGGKVLPGGGKHA